MMAHILVVEDEEHLARGIRFNLQAEGYQVSVAEDGPSALRLIEQNSPPVDLIILDLMLPGMSGYTVCETIRAAGSDTPVLMLSARTLSEDRTRGFNVGADQYLTKPFDLEELLSRVKGLLNRHQHRHRGVSNAPDDDDALVRIGSHQVNCESYEVQRSDGEIVQLTQMEMKLLKYFMTNEGRVIPRHELMENVWNQPGYLHTRAPDQFIRRLRKIFEDDASSPRHFVTIRDAGYRFSAHPSEG
ncbi:MAG: response regulator transcription factor [Planctomycetales bacterium]|nr:response regulator transcription factor [Planctomycetales bacterium]